MKNTKLFTLLALLLTAGGATMQAQVACWDGTVAEAYAGGDGTSGNPYQIARAEQLALLAQQTNEGTGGNSCYILTDTICLNGSEGYEWIAIGTEDAPFTGDFDGNNLVIKGLYNREGQCSGLFGNALNATIRNVRLTEAEIRNYGNFNGFTGFVVGKATNTNILNCNVRGNSDSLSGKQGGIVGHFIVDAPEADTAFIRDCVSFANIQGIQYVGGIAGYTDVWNGNMCIDHCANHGNLTEGTMCGGIVGLRELRHD